ncbi:MAG: hypothetical protein U0Q08_07605 [Dermatophilaceae bacterium]
MTERAGLTEAQVAALDGAVAELLDQGIIAGWVAIQTEHFRNLVPQQAAGLLALFTWADGSIEIEEDYPPYALVPELLAGTFTDEDRSANYQVVWVADDRRGDAWQRYGIHESPGHYMGLAAKQRKPR